MFHQAANQAGGQIGPSTPGEPKLPIANADWVKKILRESIYVDICEAEKTLSYKDIILDGIDYTVHWRCSIDQGRKKRKIKDRILFKGVDGKRSRTPLNRGTPKGRKRKK